MGFLSFLGWKNEGTWTFEAHKIFEKIFCMQFYCEVVCIKREGGLGGGQGRVENIIQDCLKCRSFV